MIEKDVENITEEAKMEGIDFSCPSCSAPIEFNPETNSLHCEYCGYSQVLDGVSSTAEHSLLDADLNDHSWDNETKILRCKNCGAENVVANREFTDTCPFCSSNQVAESDELAGIKPHRVVPFKIGEEAAIGIYTKWVKKRFFTPRKVKLNLIKTHVKGVYLPSWTFDANSISTYKGRLGKYYTVTVGSGKNSHTETRIRWFNIKGVRRVDFDDLLVNAGKNISQKEVNVISPYHTNESFIYDNKFLVGFTAEHYKLGLKDGWEKAKELSKPIIKNAILSKYHYDVVGSLDFSTNFDNITYKYVLVPVWIGNYDYEKKHYRYLVNGETGKLNGKAPISGVKVTITVLVSIIIIAIVVFLILHYGNFQ